MNMKLSCVILTIVSLIPWGNTVSATLVGDVVNSCFDNTLDCPSDQHWTTSEASVVDPGVEFTGIGTIASNDVWTADLSDNQLIITAQDLEGGINYGSGIARFLFSDLNYSDNSVITSVTIDVDNSTLPLQDLNYTDTSIEVTLGGFFLWAGAEPLRLVLNINTESQTVVPQVLTKVISQSDVRVFGVPIYQFDDIIFSTYAFDQSDELILKTSDYETNILPPLVDDNFDTVKIIRASGSNGGISTTLRLIDHDNYSYLYNIYRLEGNSLTPLFTQGTLNRYGDGQLRPFELSGGNKTAIGATGLRCLEYTTTSYTYPCGFRDTCTGYNYYCSKYESSIYYNDGVSTYFIGDNRDILSLADGDVEIAQVFKPNVYDNLISSLMRVRSDGTNNKTMLGEWHEGTFVPIIGDGFTGPYGTIIHLPSYTYVRDRSNYYLVASWYDNENKFHNGMIRVNPDGFKELVSATEMRLSSHMPNTFNISRMFPTSVSGNVLSFKANFQVLDENNLVINKLTQAIFLLDDQVYYLLGKGDIIDGKEVSSFGTGEDSLSGYTLLTNVFFTDGSNAIVEIALDRDADDISDNQDNCINVSNPEQADDDNNGIGNLCEDKDEDSILDIADNCPLVSNSLQIDQDNDGIGDSCDVCPLVSDPTQFDNDGDGVGNACDLDDDADSVVDIVDNCPLIPNVQQLDFDGDSIGDACDPDKDNDGIYNSVDGQVVVQTFIDESEMLSVNFTDANLGGSTYGKISSTGSLKFEIKDALDINEGLEVSVISGVGRLKFDSCLVGSKKGTLDLSIGDTQVITCGSLAARSIFGESPVILDDIAVIVSPGSAVKLSESSDGGIAVLPSPDNLSDTEVSVGSSLSLAIPPQSEVIISEEQEDSYIISVDEDSLAPVTVDNGSGQLTTLVPGDSGIIVDVDIKPNSLQNTIKLGSNGSIPVAILSSINFDAPSQIDPLSLTVASATVRLRGKGTANVSSEDTNGDGLMDFIVHFDTEALDLTEDSQTVRLEGKLYNGRAIFGSDNVNVIY